MYPTMGRVNIEYINTHKYIGTAKITPKNVSKKHLHTMLVF